MTLAAYGLAAGGYWAVTSSSSTAMAGPETDRPAIDPCSVPGGSDLRSLSAALPQAAFSEAYAACGWDVEFANGDQGYLGVSFYFPEYEESSSELDDEEDLPKAERHFDRERTEYLDGDISSYSSLEVLESRELDLGDEALVAHFTRGSEPPVSQARVLIRQGDGLVEVNFREIGDEGGNGVDFTVGEDILIGIAEQALSHLE
ncbi:hypothetical protein ABZ635_26960 [Nocardiopsis sp. NPDC007018]|uniref:hypothetical protein n=1 Tax=Nocardiopsis sp. NPDC007018 TaxID=3155721 RepID=UPI0033ED28F7